MRPRLVRPTVRLRTSYISALRGIARGDRYYRGRLAESLRDFPAFVRQQREQSSGRHLPAGYVPASSFWLVDGRRVVGLVAIRHRLNRSLQVFGGHIGYAIAPFARRRGYGTAILRLALPQARALGIRRALLTCSPRNTGSRKIIERNGGRFVDRKKSRQGVRLRFWIDLR